MTGLNIRSTPQWADYYLAVCVAENCSRSGLFERVCTWYAQQVGYRSPPPRFLHVPTGPRLNSHMTGMISGFDSRRVARVCDTPPHLPDLSSKPDMTPAD